MATIKDIARKAGVSTTTVSNVLHNKSSRVSPDTVRRIQEIIQEEGYVPNMSARSLVGAQSRILGVISSLVPLSGGGFFQDPFHAVLLSGIEQCARERGYYLMVRTVESPEELTSVLVNWNIEGLIMTGTFPETFYRELSAMGKPFVQVDPSLDSGGLKVLLDDETGGYIATKYLLDKGHRNILFCGPEKRGSIVIEKRFQGYARALSEYGLALREDFLYTSEFSASEGIRLGREIAKRHDFTAVFATADILAAEICTGLLLSGRRIPEDISVVGFDDTSISQINCPPLTTVRQDVAGRGQKAVELLVDAIESNLYAPPCIFPVSLIERESVRALSQD
ncbi:MAG: LacI family DNA-binding transcriptional regulator [Clostridia bacterium]|nr:LacI family DNA-binding transcriptional regulator [Clostridia bacterium]MBR1686533.1 LacI family DNA-binding transcriptional regulator [Clostridia bacterium]